MRTVLVVVALALASFVPVAAGQQTPPPARPATATPQTAPPPRPTAVTPPATPQVPGVRPSTVKPPAVPRVPMVAVPDAGFAPQAVPPTGSTPRPGTAPQTAPPSATSQATSWQNVKLDVTISDTLYADVQNKKTVTMLILDGRSGSVRSSGGEGLINVDATPTIRQDGRIYLRLSVEYRPELTSQQVKDFQLSQRADSLRLATFTESLALIVVDGKQIVVSQSADPRSDRKVSLEITASILK